MTDRCRGATATLIAICALNAGCGTSKPGMFSDQYSLRFNTGPSAAKIATAIAPAVAVQILAANGDALPASTVLTQKVQLHLFDAQGQALSAVALGGTTSVDLVANVAMFTDLHID